MTLKSAFLSFLFNDKLYLVDSETAIQRNYADLTLILRPDLRSRQNLRDFILEFKFVKLSSIKLPTPQVSTAKTSKARKTTADATALRPLSRYELCALPAIAEQLTQARTQLQTYRHDLQASYGNTLRLHTYAVIAVGFERIICVET